MPDSESITNFQQTDNAARNDLKHPITTMNRRYQVSQSHNDTRKVIQEHVLRMNRTNNRLSLIASVAYSFAMSASGVSSLSPSIISSARGLPLISTISSLNVRSAL